LCQLRQFYPGGIVRPAISVGIEGALHGRIKRSGPDRPRFFRHRRRALAIDFDLGVDGALIKIVLGQLMMITNFRRLPRSKAGYLLLDRELKARHSFWKP